MQQRDGKSGTLAPAAIALGVLVFLLAQRSQASVNYTITFEDPAHTYVPYYDGIRRNLLAAGADWARHFDASATLNIRVRFDTEKTMSGGSTSTYFTGTFEGKNVYEMRCAAKLLGHMNPDDPGPDAILNIGAGRSTRDPNGYLQKSLWFDPSPERRTVPVPRDRSDAYSGFLHELGHIFIFNGFLDPHTGEADAATGISTFDRHVICRRHTVGGRKVVDFFFTGPAARSLYGRDIPLTFGCYAHFGNAAPRPGADLASFDRLEVMNGVTGYQGTRYRISALDLAVCEDAGLPVLHGDGVAAAPPRAAPAPPQPAAPAPNEPVEAVLPVPGESRVAFPIAILIATAAAFAATLAAWRLRKRGEQSPA